MFGSAQWNVVSFADIHLVGRAAEFCASHGTLHDLALAAAMRAEQADLE